MVRLIFARLIAKAWQQAEAIGYRIMTAAAPGVTPQKPQETQPEARDEAKTGYGLARIA